MNTELFIAKRIVFDKNGKQTISRPIVNIATWGISLGMIVMILSVAIVTGFKSEIHKKVIGFGSHIQIKNYDSNNSFEDVPISRKQSFYPSIEKVDGIKHIQVFATKVGLIKTAQSNEELLIKGVGGDFDWTFFKENLVEGEVFKVDDSIKSDKILISRYFANKMEMKVGDKVRAFFVNKDQMSTLPKALVFHVSGIYETGMEEFDKKIALVDIANVQRLYGWNKNEIGGFEVSIQKFENLGLMYNKVYDLVGYNINPDGSKLDVKTIKDLHPEIFDWLAYLDVNVWIILILMVVVASFNMISALLIIILERVNMIGILKALGTSNISVRRIFIYNAVYLIGKGLLMGNIVGLILCAIQYYFHIVTLPKESYYVSVVPININWAYLGLLNVGSLLICSLMILLPSYMIAKISPIKAIRYK